MVNRIMLAGTILSKDKDGITLETNELSFDGNEEYSHVHPVLVSTKDLKSLKKGMRVKLHGKFGRDKETRRGRIEATSIVTNYAGSDINKGELVGTAHRSFQFFKAMAEKQAFGNVIVNLGDSLLIRGVCFNPTCHRFNIDCTTGSTVQVLGRIQHRPYDDREGKPQRMIEVVGDDDFTHVLESVKLVNPFDVDDEEAVEAI